MCQTRPALSFVTRQPRACAPRARARSNRGARGSRGRRAQNGKGLTRTAPNRDTRAGTPRQGEGAVSAALMRRAPAWRASAVPGAARCREARSAARRRAPAGRRRALHNRRAARTSAEQRHARNQNTRSGPGGQAQKERPPPAALEAYAQRLHTRGRKATPRGAPSPTGPAPRGQYESNPSLPPKTRIARAHTRAARASRSSGRQPKTGAERTQLGHAAPRAGLRAAVRGLRAAASRRRRCCRCWARTRPPAAAPRGSRQRAGPSRPALAKTRPSPPPRTLRGRGRRHSPSLL